MKICVAEIHFTVDGNKLRYGFGASAAFAAA